MGPIIQQILVDLEAFRIDLFFPKKKVPLSLLFDTPSRKFILGLIGFIIIEMAKRREKRFVSIQRESHKKTLTLLDQKLSGRYASETLPLMFGKIRKVWRGPDGLGDLRKGRRFKVMDRKRVKPFDEEGAGVEYECSDSECDAWSNLISYDKSTGKAWSYRFAVDEVGMTLEDVRVVFGKAEGIEAWDTFLKSLTKYDYHPEHGDSAEIDTDKSESHLTEGLVPFLDMYLKLVEKDHRYLDTKHILPLKGDGLELNRTYVRLKAIPEVAVSESSHLTEHEKWLSCIHEDFAGLYRIVEKQSPPPLPIETILSGALQGKSQFGRHMVLIGSPGVGKTTLLRYLAHSLASEESRIEGLEGFIPLFVALSEYAQSGEKDLVKYIIEASVRGIVNDTNRKGITNFLKTEIDQCTQESPPAGRLVFLLDGLDEVGPAKKKISTEIRRLGNLYESACIIITSRIAGYSEAPLTGFYHFLLDHLHDEDIRDFIKRWFDFLGEKGVIGISKDDAIKWSVDRTNRLLNQVERSPSLKRMSSIPLNLSFITSLASDPDTQFPETRTELYRRFLEEHLLKREQERREKIGQCFPVPWDELLAGFEDMCWIIHKALFGEKQRRPTKDFLKRSLLKSTHESAKKLLDFWINAGIFFLVKTQDGTEIVLPRLYTLLEYGLARKLAGLWENPVTREEIWEVVKRNLHNRYLREPLALFVGIINDLSNFVTRVSDLRDDFFHRNLILLCQLICDQRQRLEAASWIKLLLSRLHDIWEEHSVATKEIEFDILKCFGCLGGPNLLQMLFERCGDKDTCFRIQMAIAECIHSDTLEILEHAYREETELLGRIRIAEWIYQLGEKEKALSLFEALLKETRPYYEYGHLLKAIFDLGERDVALSFAKDLIELADGEDSRNESAHLFVMAADKSILEFILERFKKEDYLRVRRNLARAVARMGEKEKAISLFKQLLTPDAMSKLRHLAINEHRGDIALRIAELGDRGYALNILRDILEEEVVETDDRTRKWAVAREIGDLGNETDAINLLQVFKNEKEDIDFKREIISSLGKLGNTEVIPFLEDLFEREDDFFLRQRIAEALAGLGEEDFAISLLKRIYVTDFSLVHRKYVVDSMLELGKKTLAVSLYERICKAEPDSKRRRDIIDKIGLLGSKETAISLFKREFCLEPNLMTHASIAFRILRLGNKKAAIRLLKKILKKAGTVKAKEIICAFSFSIIYQSRLLIFENESGSWDIIEVPERYTF